MRLRGLANKFHKDLTKSEVLKALGFVENVFQCMVTQRKLLASYLQENMQLESICKSFEALPHINTTSGNLAPQEFVKEWIYKQKVLLSDFVSIYISNLASF
jgi:hypothetical protein